MTSPSRLAAALRNQAQGVYCFEAAAELLITHRSWLHRTDFTAQFVHVKNGLIDGRSMAIIDWAEAITALQAGHLPCSGGEHRILRIAASLTDGIPGLLAVSSGFGTAWRLDGGKIVSLTA